MCGLDMMEFCKVISIVVGLYRKRTVYLSKPTEYTFVIEGNTQGMTQFFMQTLRLSVGNF